MGQSFEEREKARREAINEAKWEAKAHIASEKFQNEPDAWDRYMWDRDPPERVAKPGEETLPALSAWDVVKWIGKKLGMTAVQVTALWEIKQYLDKEYEKSHNWLEMDTYTYYETGSGTLYYIWPTLNYETYPPPWKGYKGEIKPLPTSRPRPSDHRP